VADSGAYATGDLDLSRVRSLLVDGQRYTRVGAEQMIDLRNGRLGLGADSDGAYAATIVQGALSLVIFPTPTEAGKTITAIVNADPPLLSTDSDVPIIPAGQHIAIVYGAIATGRGLVDEDAQSAACLRAEVRGGEEAARAGGQEGVGLGPGADPARRCAFLDRGFRAGRSDAGLDRGGDGPRCGAPPDPGERVLRP
jgi:hypothetical protein